MTVTLSPAAPGVRALIESRPPAASWSTYTTYAVPADQPLLDLRDLERADPAQPHEPSLRATVVRARWTVPPRPGLPEATTWSTSLVLAVLQVLLAQRPIAQLNRWLDDEVLGAVAVRQRRRRIDGARGAIPVRLRSLRVQHPHPEVAEVSAHAVVGTASTPVALRLEALGDRWLCTALELDPRFLSPRWPYDVNRVQRRANRTKRCT